MFVIYVLPCCSSTSDAPCDSKLISYMMLEALCHQLLGLCRNRDNKSTLPVQT